MRERHITQIARQPDARGQHHVRMRTGTAQPRRGCREQTGEVGGCAHDGSPDTAARASDSRRRILIADLGGALEVLALHRTLQLVMKSLDLTQHRAAGPPRAGALPR
jgi:hypothetical protein